MRKEIPTYITPDKGNLQQDVVINTNKNTQELYNQSVNYGQGIQHFLAKLRSQANLKDSTIRIATIGDSILAFWNASGYSIEDYFNEKYPNLTFEFRTAAYGGTGSDYIISPAIELANWNPDLVIIGEWENYEQAEYLEKIIQLFRDKTSSDIALFPHSIGESDMLFLQNNDINEWINSQTYVLRKFFFHLKSKYNCGFLDIHQPWIRELLDGNETTDTLLRDTIHPTDHAYSYTFETLNLSFSDLWDNWHLSYNEAIIQNTIYFKEAVELPDITNIIKSGIWDVNQVDADRSFFCLRSSEVGAYVEFKFEGIGFELAHFGDEVGQFDILIDEPSAILKDYFVMGGLNTKKVFKIIINNNILSNIEDSRDVYIIINAVGETLDYTVRDNTNGQDLGTGNSGQDETFNFLTGSGQITIPSKYAGVDNFVGVFSQNDYLINKVYKNWYDSVDIAADSLTKVTRIFGLERKEHTVRLTVSSGTVNLDSILELK